MADQEKIRSAEEIWQQFQAMQKAAPRLIDLTYSGQQPTFDKIIGAIDDQKIPFDRIGAVSRQMADKAAQTIESNNGSERWYPAADKLMNGIAELNKRAGDRTLGYLQRAKAAQGADLNRKFMMDNLVKWADYNAPGIRENIRRGVPQAAPLATLGTALKMMAGDIAAGAGKVVQAVKTPLMMTESQMELIKQQMLRQAMRQQLVGGGST